VDLPGRSAVVTGGAGGLGSATVRRLVAIGLSVVVLDRRSAGADELVADLGQAVSVVGGEVDDDDAVMEAIHRATALGPLSVLVNVAGGGVGGGATVGDDGRPHDLDSFARTMASNAVGTFNVTRLVAAAMAVNDPDTDGQRGVVVHTASIAAMEGQRGQVAYAAAKAAIVGMTLPMARDLATIGVRVCTVAPGPMSTPIMERVLAMVEHDPVEGVVFPDRMGRPDEFALLVEAIVRNPYLNGEVVRLDGGLRLHPGDVADRAR
jgi:NAD(P)-dependent dehydrogenase (short-subunit alcohol dehydrogenase family)